jgi:8-oxo-dGTP pyrophosphatase MutT (NUDIX family)
MKRVAAIAIINDHHMLMGKRRDNQRFTNPGGHLNPGEDPLKGAVREVKEETGLDLDPHLFKHVETRIVKKKDGTKIEVHGFRVDLPQKPSTSMKQDPDGEVFRWHWIKLDTDLDHIKDNLHVPLGDNVLLDNILKDKPMRRHARRFWESAKKVGLSDEVKDKLLKEGPQQYMQRRDNEKKAAEHLQGGKADGMPDSKFPQDQLRMGRKIEKEHTKDPAKANEVAKDHLTEDKKYYTHLKEMEDKYVEKKAFWDGFRKRGSCD